LEDAIKLAKQLYDKVGKGKIKREVAAGALGYSGLSGSSLTTIGALNQYGLIEQERGAGVWISPLAVRIFHPLSEQDARAAKMTAALMPKVFSGLYTDGFHHCEESILANNLIQNGFTPDQAKKVAAVYLENTEFTNLKENGINKAATNKRDEIKEFSLDDAPQELKDYQSQLEAANEKTKGKKMLAQYAIPIGANEATITFTGEKLSAEDFTALGEYVILFKTQFERKQNAEVSKQTPPKPEFPNPPFTAIWKGKGFEKSVTIAGQPVLEKGEWIYQDSGGVLIPAKEIFYNFK
jgi:hypothetical protein